MSSGDFKRALRARIHYDATNLPTISRFLLCNSRYAVICSGRGGGKTSAGCIRAYMRARNVDPRHWPLKWAVIRDTRKNIGKTVAITLKHWFPQPFARWRGKEDEPESCVIYVEHKPIVHFDFFGVDSPKDQDRFQSYEASGGVWIEEPCPISTNTEFLASGVSEAVLATAVTSLRNGPNPCVQITMNPPSADHWTAQLFHLPGFEAAGNFEDDMPEEQRRERENIRRETTVFMVPPSECAAEKEHPGYREQNRQILLATGRNDLFARLVEGRIGYAQVGAKVTPAFNASHLAPGIQVMPNIPIILSFDFGLNPSCIAAQLSPQGYLLIHRAWTRQGVGMKQLLELDVHPWLAQQPTTHWWYCGGPEAREREQSDSEETALKMIIQKLGPAAYRAGPVSWSARRDAMDDALTRTPGGLPWVRISQTGAPFLVRALDGGWHYPTDSMGRVRREGQPDKKSVFDHVGDAFAHLCAVLLHKTDAAARSVSSPTRAHSHVRYTSPTRSSAVTTRTGV